MSNRPRYWPDAAMALPASVPAAETTSPAAFEAERARVFRRAWLAVARVEEMPNRGDFLRIALPTTGTVVVLMRGDDGVVRAFHNRCAHRGVALVEAERGHARHFRCPYHGWLYGADGRLRALPDASAFPHVRCGETGLPSIACATWNGFLFVNLSPEPQPTLDAYLGDFGALFADLPFHDYPAGIVMTQTVAGNWKSIIHASGEGYHISTLHRDTLHPQVRAEDNPFSDFHDPRLLGLHATATLTRNVAWKPTTATAHFALATMLPEIVEAMEGMANGRGIAGHPGINRIGLPNFQIEAMTLFPNSLLQIIPTGWLWLQMWPTAHNETILRVRLYTRRQPGSHREAFAAASVHAQARDVVSEDLAMVELQQTGLSSDPSGDQILGKNEYLLRFFAQQIARYMAAPDVRALFPPPTP